MRVFFIIAATLALSACGGASVHKSNLQTSNLQQPSVSLAQAARAYERKPDNESRAIIYAALLREQGTLNRASAILSPFAQGSNNPALFAELSNLYRTLGDSALAIRYARKAIELAPEDGSGHFALAQSYDARSQFEEAEKAYETARDLFASQGDQTHQIDLLTKLAFTKASLDKHREAEQLLREASILNPGDRNLERNLRIMQALVQSYTATAPKPNVKPHKPD